MSAAFSLADPDPALAAVVVVPARDEAARIEACVSAFTRQEGVACESFEVIVVLDGCRDGTADVLREMHRKHPRLRLHTLKLSVSVGVGRARRLGMDLACARLLDLGRDDGLIASTDADSVVAVDWLAEQLRLIEAGARAIGGHIELDPEESELLDAQALVERERSAGERLKSALRESMSGAPVEHHHFSGASLALTARTYENCGGLPVRAALEDEALERELHARGVTIHRSRRVQVRTSARTSGRAPRGLARDLARADWRARRSYRAEQFPLGELLERKDSTIALVLPAREVAATIGPIAEQAARLRDLGLLDEVLLVDAASKDATARIATETGLKVVQEDELSVEFGPALGKGDAMWRGLAAVDCEIVAFADTDTEDFAEHFLTGLLGPLVWDPQVQLVKGFFERPFRFRGTLVAAGGGRVTELMARPLLNLHAPELAVFDQPLAGETAGRRELLERLAFSAGYGVEIAMLIDAWRLIGLDGLAQVDLGVRQNRHQPLRELSAMAYAVLVAAQTRFLGEEFADAQAAGTMLLPTLEGARAMESRRVVVEERPALAKLKPTRASAP
ncbi:MAG TPA: glucosyl-3-phosphoglycerate synthase [Solirubrobacteraceae bacterium]